MNLILKKTSTFFSKVFKAVLGFLYHFRHFFKRLGIALITLAFSTVLIFFIIRLIPGDLVHEYALQLVQQRGMLYEDAYIMAVRMLNFDPKENLVMQLFRYVGGLFRGELGNSVKIDGVSANLLIKQRLPWTLFLTSTALIISFLLGTAMGSFMARKRKGAAHSAMNSYIIVSGAIPDYLLGLLLVFLFAYVWKIFPAQGNYDIFFAEPGFNIRFIFDVLRHAFLPIAAYVIVQTGSWALLMRSSSIGVLGEDYINAARARGLPEGRITRKYLKRNALLPLVTNFALTFGSLFGGAALMESVFNYPGLGMELSKRIAEKEYFIVQGLMFFSSAMVILINLVTDSVYSVIDPRVRRGD